MSVENFNAQEVDLVYEWAERWLSLINLINQITGTAEPPTAGDEIEYQSLRRWFLDNELKFLPLWRDYDGSRTVDDADDIESTDSDMNQYVINPFLFFYEPQDLHKLALHLELQESDQCWGPSEKEASILRAGMVGIGKILIDFVPWVEDRVNGNYLEDSN